MLDLDLKERVRAAVDLVDVIGASLTLVPKGRLLAARCPWHDDRSPSLTVNRERQTWKCWVCDIGGDVFSYIMRRDGVDFLTALRMLADQAGIEYQLGRQAEAGSKDDKATLLAAVRLVCDAYYEQLDQPRSDDAKAARDYLARRGIDDKHRKLYQIGFAPDQWEFATGLLAQAKFRPEIAAAAGVALNRRHGNGSYDLFRGRLMFPICDLQNRPISMGGRVIPEIAQRHGDKAGGKYINGPETKLFRKSQQLYGLQLAREAIRKRGQALVMEGYTDVIATRQAGIEPVVAVLGTALGPEHVKLLARLTDRVVLVLDGDAAGRRRADEVLELFVTANADLRVLTLPDGLDPADYLQQHGAASLEAAIETAPDALEHKLNTLTAGIDLTEDTHAVMQAIDTMTGILAKAGKMDPLKQDQMLLRLSRKFDVATERLEERLRQHRQQHQQRQRNADRFRAAEQRQRQPAAPGRDAARRPGTAPGGIRGTAPTGQPAAQAAAQAAARCPARPEPLSGYDRELFEAMIESPMLAAQAVEVIDPEWLESWTAKMLLSAYQELELQGRDLDAETLLALVENETLKNEIVTMQFRVAQRAGKITQTAEERFQLLLQRFFQRETLAEKQRQIARLQSAGLDESEELEVLKQLFDGEKDRHQINR